MLNVLGAWVELLSSGKNSAKMGIRRNRKQEKTKVTFPTHTHTHQRKSPGLECFYK